MLTVRHRPDLATPALLAWLRPFVSYDAGGRSSAIVKDELAPLPAELAPVTAAFPGAYHVIALQAYRDGAATTPCHSDGTVTGFSLILSLGATRTFRIHRGDCDSPTDVMQIECTRGTVVVMEAHFHDTWHHQLAADPGVTEERLGLVFRSKPRRVT